jgi:transcriptional regulator with XRE-family HTH domain
MAQRLGVGQSFVSKIERGDSYVEVFTCVDWCTVCGMTPGALLNGLVLQSPHEQST